ncbi:hypothetical protein NIES2119_12140 [[Phormidium ambiguum] IAM M-71]|uniref:Glycosyl transferase n=1 Tax=[Phormidium ambiguum] IAM M-71 TaxID=454136 RepID=A0A1U7IKW7_9CYAN|nr:hypothetical protein [Phormidium ambiguum]OKH37888.1 hypothetical protein NIES2119_12140 [Phormidium ambiguum IAM M-71]
MEDFGIIIACCDQDYHYAKGCCASIRYFLGDVPICLIIDGEFLAKDLQKAYGVQVINHLNVKHQVLRERSFGWGLTKMVAFWESPWSNFLFLDADTIVWGNILKYANFQDFDVIVDRPLYKDSFEEFSRFFFKPQEIEKYFPDFQWQKHFGQYFCTGAFFAKRDIFSIDEYIYMLDFVDRNPDVFWLGEQGFLNLMLFRNYDAGKIRLSQSSWQVIVPKFQWDELKNRFFVEQNSPVVKADDTCVIHWAGPKPTLYNSQVYSEPMNFFRRKFIQETEGLTGLPAEALLKLEDLERDLNIYQKKLVRKVRKLMKLSINTGVNY